MSKYGQAAIDAMDLILATECSPLEAWQQAAARIFASAPESMKKTCPRAAFMGLYAAGLLRGVAPQGTLPERRRTNRVYAIKAIELLMARPELAQVNPPELWRRLMATLGADAHKQHNQQMDVVLTLWLDGRIEGGPAASQRH